MNHKFTKMGLLIRYMLIVAAMVSKNTAYAQQQNVPLFFEKIYLHTDRELYEQGEDIWFKAYVVNAQNNGVINYSHTLYAELINPEARIVIRNVIRLDNGTGNGDFKLTDSIPPGHYRIRAYTNWIRNFGDNFVFEKSITIFHTQGAPDIKPASNINKTKEKNTTAASLLSATTVASPSIRFFPEGGSLVEGISSIVGVKAEDTAGKGIAAKGSVVSLTGDTIARFTCDSLGMGLFTLLPVKGQTYRAVADLNGGMLHQRQQDHSVFELPATLSGGLTLQIRQTDSVINAVINSLGLPAVDKIILVVKHAGKTQLYKPLQPQQSLQTTIKIPTAALPEGISAITLYDGQGKPHCERLVYIHHPGSNNKVQISPDKKIYQPKELVTVNIHTRPNARLSMAVVDARTTPVGAENILSYLNLQSEIKGRIEKPTRYFDTTNVNRFKQLDLLMLTQGWRDFLWRRLEDTTLKLSYEPEQGIAVTGKVRAVMSKKPLPGIYISMHAPKAAGVKFFDAVTDSAGRFGIYGLKFYGYQYLYLNARNYASKAKGKSNSGGWLQVDSLMRDTLPVRPVKQFTGQDTLSLTNPLLTLNIPPSRQLKEVQIKGGNPYANSIAPEHRTLSMAEQKDYGNVLQYLLYTIPEAHTGGGACGIVLMDNNAPAYQMPIGIGGSYADRSPMEDSSCSTDFLMLPMSNVLKLTIYRFYDGDFRLRLSVSLVLRPGSLKVKDFFDDTMADINGYYPARVFYKANYEDQNDKPDPRNNTIHWEPNIITDNNGTATVRFYNTPQKGNIRVIIQGITDTGEPLVSNAGYEVK